MSIRIRERFRYNAPLSETHPEVAAMWSEKNLPLRPDQVTAGGHDMVFWKCPVCGGEWEARVVSVTKAAKGCPFCGNRRILPGYNDLATIRPDLLSEWNYKKNDPLLPSQIGHSSTKKVWWKCVNGHEYQMSVDSKAHGNRCPVCAGRINVTGVNDLATRYPELAAEWSDKNLPLTPDHVFGFTTRKYYWWKCPDCGNDYYYSLTQRLNNGYGCPYCEGNQVLPGMNDLVTTDPEIAKEWDYEKNGERKPEQFFRSNIKNAWWKCSRGHSYMKSIYARAVERSGCPVCEAEFAACLPGMAAIHFAKAAGLEIMVMYQRENGDVLETYIPEKHLAVEADCVSETGRREQRKKAARCRKAGITLKLIPRMKDQQMMVSAVRAAIEQSGVVLPDESGNLAAILKEELLGPEVPIGEAAKQFDGKAGRKGGTLPVRRQTLAEAYPGIAAEWSEKNFPFTPQDELCGSVDRVWWRCSNGHEWMTPVSTRIRGSACPYCCNRKVLKGFNDFESVHPDLAAEWSDKNGDLKPDQLLAGSRETVWWKCSKGHEWQTTIINRTRGNGCPVCEKGPLIPGQNDLASVYPEIVPYWSEKNLPLKPEDIRLSNRRQYWWICSECGKSYLSQPGTKYYYQKVRNSCECPECRKKKAKNTSENTGGKENG